MQSKQLLIVALTGIVAIGVLGNKLTEAQDYVGDLAAKLKPNRVVVYKRIGNTCFERIKTTERLSKQFLEAISK